MARKTTKTLDTNLNSTVEEVSTVEKVTVTKLAEPLTDDEEIAIVSIIPNVSYKDSKTGDFYEWDSVGHIEYMTFGTLKNLWRSHKGYFRNLVLRPEDDRVINQFGLKKVFEQYDFLMDSKSYTSKNINKICETIKGSPNALKFSIINKIKQLIDDELLTDINVIKRLEKDLDIDLV